MTTLDVTTHMQRAQGVGHTLASAGGAPVQMVDWKRAAKYTAIGGIGAAIGAAAAPVWIGAGLGAMGGAALGVGASGLREWLGGNPEPANERHNEQAPKRRRKKQPKPQAAPKQFPRRRRVNRVESDDEEKESKQPLLASNSNFNPLAGHLDFLNQPKKKAQQRKRKQGAKAAARAEREAAEERERERLLDETRKFPRHVVRHDRDFTSKVNNRSGQGKAHRVGSDLMPAGTTKVSAVEQLHQNSPNKGSSNRISFASLKAARANDYSDKGTRPSVRFKFRKARRAQIKNKQDASTFRALSANEVLDEVDRDNSAYGKQHKGAAKAFAAKDGEHQAVGTIPKRFLKWSDDHSDSDAESDSDSDNEETDGE